MTKQNRPRGRPKDDSKRVALLDAARSLFLSRGPEVTMEEIAATAGVAKATLYAKFTDKDSLVEAVIRRESDLTITDEQFSEFTNRCIDDALHDFGLQFVKFINSHNLLGWDRLIASLEIRRSDLPKRFFDLGPGRGQRLLTQLIELAIERGDLETTDAEYAADALAGLWLGFVNLEIKLGVRAPLAADEIEHRVQRGVRIFMSVYGRGEAPGLADKQCFFGPQG